VGVSLPSGERGKEDLFLLLLREGNEELFLRRGGKRRGSIFEGSASPAFKSRGGRRKGASFSPSRRLPFLEEKDSSLRQRYKGILRRRERGFLLVLFDGGRLIVA